MNTQESSIPASDSENSLKLSRTVSEIRAWLIESMAKKLDIAPEEIDTTRPFESYGLDSEAAVVLSGDLQEWLGCELEPTLLFDYPTIEAVVQFLVAEN